MTMATRIVVMNNGSIQQVGTPQQVYEALGTFSSPGSLAVPP